MRRVSIATSRAHKVGLPWRRRKPLDLRGREPRDGLEGLCRHTFAGSGRLGEEPGHFRTPVLPACVPAQLFVLPRACVRACGCRQGRVHFFALLERWMTCATNALEPAPC